MVHSFAKGATAAIEHFERWKTILIDYIPHKPTDDRYAYPYPSPHHRPSTAALIHRRTHPPPLCLRFFVRTFAAPYKCALSPPPPPVLRCPIPLSYLWFTAKALLWRPKYVRPRRTSLSIPIKGSGVAFSGGVIRRLNSTQWRNPIILERSRGGALATILRSDCTALLF
jgi:hypothetical protein